MCHPTSLCIPSSILFLTVLVLTGISYFTFPNSHSLTLFIAQTHFNGAVVQLPEGLSEGVSKIQFGIWGICYYESEKDRTCYTTDHVTIAQGNNVVVLNWQKEQLGLAVQPCAFALSLIGLLLGLGLFGDSTRMEYYVSLLTKLGALLTFIALFIDVWIYGYFRSKLNKLGATDNLGSGAVFVLALFSFLVSLSCALLYHWAVKRRHAERKAWEVRDMNIKQNTKDPETPSPFGSGSVPIQASQGHYEPPAQVSRAHSFVSDPYYHDHDGSRSHVPVPVPGYLSGCPSGHFPSSHVPANHRVNHHAYGHGYSGPRAPSNNTSNGHGYYVLPSNGSGSGSSNTICCPTGHRDGYYVHPSNGSGSGPSSTSSCSTGHGYPAHPPRAVYY